MIYHPFKISLLLEIQKINRINIEFIEYWEKMIRQEN